MGQLSAGIAHELNNPLGVVIMYSNILLEEADPKSTFADDLKLIAEQAERCKRIVGGLLNFARKNQVNFEEIDVLKLCEKSLNSVIVPGGIKVSLHCKTNNRMAMLDAEQMIQVLTNLVKNAFEAMPSGGELKLNIDGTNADVLFEIQDSGTGIKPEDLDKIFEPFFTTKGIGKGTGLGLATAYGIVKMHKGQISVTSNTQAEKGPTGTKFSIRIPRSRT
jgi:signal transduction histidine kinase